MAEIPSFIAVVDDDESMCQALRRLLQVSGYLVRTYFSAEAFLADPEHTQARFVVADIQLQGMSGFDLQRIIHQKDPSVPFAFITAHDGAETRAQAKACGVAAYLRKPFPAQTLIAAINNGLAEGGGCDQ